MHIIIQKFILFFKNIIYVLPFVGFCIGYIGLQFFIADQVIHTPDLVGKTMLEAVKICSKLKLNLRIVAEKEIADTIPGTIIIQNPGVHGCIKQHQSIFVTITTLPALTPAPHLINKKIAEIETMCIEQNIKPRYYPIPSQCLHEICIAQFPIAGTLLPGKKIHAYIAQKVEPLFLLPDFTGKSLDEVMVFLNKEHILYDIFYKHEKLIAPYQQKYIISYQKPLAGTLVNPFQSGLQLHLQVNIIS